MLGLLLAVFIRGSKIRSMEERKKSGVAGCVVIGVIGFIVPVLYVLSIGPAVLVLANYPAAEPWMNPVYFPIVFVADNCSQAEDALAWYVDLWGGGVSVPATAPPPAAARALDDG